LQQRDRRERDPEALAVGGHVRPREVHERDRQKTSRGRARTRG
jgi:hypothetical protein